MDEVVQNSEAPVVETPSTEAASVTTDIKTVGTEAESTPAVPAYTPNYKFKVMDEEKEFDEWARPVVKDADTEKKVKELFEKAYGLDHVKPRYEEAKQKLVTTEKEYNQLLTDVRETLGYKEKDLDAFFDAVGLSEDKVAEWMLQKIKKLDLPPEQRAVYDQLQETRRHNMLLEKQFQQFETQSQQTATQARALELESVLSRPEVSSLAKAYDSARKKPGAFRDFVIEHGTRAWVVNNKDLTAEQATREAMEMLSPIMGTTTSEPIVETPDKSLPVIPRVAGKAVSPTGKKPRSLEDLKKMSQEVSA